MLASLIADAIKPYKTGGNAAFWTLNQLDRIDKHRTFVPVQTKREWMHTAIPDKHDLPPVTPGTIFLLFDKERRQIPLTVGSPAYIYNQNNGYPTIEILFGDADIVGDNKAVIPTLHKLAQLIRETIDAFDKAVIDDIAVPAQ